MAHGSAPDGKDPSSDSDAWGHCGQKRQHEEVTEDCEATEEDQPPSTRPCLHLENGGSAPSSISTSRTMSRALRPLPTGQLRETMVVLCRSETHAPAVLSGLQQLYHEDNLCDVTIRVDGEDFRAHRVVLAASSDFLRFVCATNSTAYTSSCLPCCLRAPQTV
jgi:hypothetical protein